MDFLKVGLWRKKLGGKRIIPIKKLRRPEDACLKVLSRKPFYGLPMNFCLQWLQCMSTGRFGFS